MADSIMYQEDGFVVLETNQPETFLNSEELLTKLQSIIVSHPEILPRQLNKFDSLEKKAQYLLNNYCELDFEDGNYLQWYVIRLEK
jgi:hypothetical protein